MSWLTVPGCEYNNGTVTWSVFGEWDDVYSLCSSFSTTTLFFDTLLFFWYLSQDSCCWWGVGEDGWEVVCHRFLKRRRMVHWGWGEADEGQVEMVVVVGSWLHKFTKVYTMTPLFLACPGWQILDVNTKWDSNVVCLQRLGQFSFLLLLLFNHYTFFHTLLLFWYLSQDSCCWTVS